MQRTKAERRANDRRHINRRINVLKNAWHDTTWLYDANQDIDIDIREQPNRLRKFNLNCTCRAHNRMKDDDRRYYQAREKAHVDNEYNDWYNDV